MTHEHKIPDEVVELLLRTMFFHEDPGATEGEYLDARGEADELRPAARAGLQAALSMLLGEPVGTYVHRPASLRYGVDWQDAVLRDGTKLYALKDKQP